MSTPAGDGLVGNAVIRVDGDTDPAVRALRQLQRTADGRLRDIRGRFASESEIINRSLTNAAGGGDRFSLSLRSLVGVAGRAGGALAAIAGPLARIGAAVSAPPLLAGIVTTLEQIAPAGAVAVTGMLAVQQASAAVKLGMVGVEDAAAAAFDTSAEGAEAFAEAIEKLAPNARAFAVQLRELAPALTRLQQGVQNRLFIGFADELDRLAKQVLPVVRTNLNSTALTLNRMALGASVAARELAVNGTLGKAMAGANQGLLNLRRIPGQVVTALGQLATAGAPAFDRITAAAAGAATGISERLGAAFESGALENAVNTAVDVLKDLGEVGGNVFATLGNVIAPVQEQGAGLVGLLLEITGALRDATATQGFQDAISALAGVMSTLAQTAGPLLGQALAAIGPVFTTLGPPVERLIESLGAALSPIIEALGPVLAAAAVAVGVLVDAISPLLPVVGELIASLLPPLVPVIQAIAQAFAGAAPIVQQLGEILTAVLAPIIAQLPTILTPLIDTFTNLTSLILPILSDLLTQLAPTLAQIGQSFGELLIAVGPLLEVLGRLIGEVLVALLPLLTPIIALVAQLAAVFADQLANIITNVVVPAITLITALLSGDASGAWRAFKDLIAGVGRFIGESVSNMGKVITMILGTIVGTIQRLPGRIFAALASLAGGLVTIAGTAWRRFSETAARLITAAVAVVQGLPGRAFRALSGLAGDLRSRASEAGRALVSEIRSRISAAVEVVRGLPGRAREVLGGLGGILADSGRALIQGFIDGITSKIGAVTDAVGSVVGAARDLFPGSPAKEGPFSGNGWVLYSGRAVGEGFAKGIAQRAEMARRSAEDLVDGVVTTTNGLLGISSPSKVFARIGRDTGRGFIKGLTGTRAQIKSTAEKVIGSIREAFKGRRTRLDDRLVSLVRQGNARLQSLAKQRDQIAKRIADAQKFAADITATARATGSLGTIVSEDFAAPRLVEARMRDALARIKAFTSNVQKLAKRGVSKALLRQILELGPEQGGAFAEALAGADAATIKRYNKLQADLDKQSKKLGRQGADLLYDSGRKAGDGFLAGLKAQQKNIEKLMLNIARGMQKAIRKALGIKSPSTVMAAIGRLSVLGLQGGITRAVPAVDAAMARVAKAVASGVPAMLPAEVGRTAVPALGVGAMRTGAGAAVTTVNITLNLENRGVIGSRLELQNWMTRMLDDLDRQGRLSKLRAA